MRWGHHGVGLGAVGALSTWAPYQWGPFVLDELDLEVLPVAPVFDAKAPMPHPQGLVGVDRSARPGDGSEFSSIRVFQLGDRLRRIHWPSSLRSRTLNVTATYADHDSQVVVVVDAANDIGVSGGIDGSPEHAGQHRARGGGAVRALRPTRGPGRPAGRRARSAAYSATLDRQAAPAQDAVRARRVRKTGGLLVADSAEDRERPPRLRVDPGAMVSCARR